VKSRTSSLHEVASAAVGSLRIHGESFVIETHDRVELLDLTERVTAYVRQFGIREGMIGLWAMHTTCALFISEAQEALLTDVKSFLENTVARDHYYMHNDPAHSDCDRRNADSHLRAMLLGQSLTVQVSAGEVVLGQWQRIFMAELDGPRSRTLRAQLWGIA
jgi:secondary thiamine-phosphate synthase enzyme